MLCHTDECHIFPTHRLGAQSRPFLRLPPGHDPGGAVRELPHPVHLSDLADGDEVTDEAEARVADVRRDRPGGQAAPTEGRGGGCCYHEHGTTGY